MIKIIEFIRAEQLNPQYSKLKIKQVSGRTPTLILINESQEVDKRLGVDNWDTDTLREYLNKIF
jgi:hypothetical protein